MMEFLTSAWLWLIPILLGLRYWFKRSKSRFGRFGIGTLLVIFGWKFLIASWGIVHPVRVEVVDQITGKPIVGVKAFAAWEIYPMLPTTVCTGSRMQLTDENGKAIFRWEPARGLYLLGIPIRSIGAVKTSMTFPTAIATFFSVPDSKLVGGDYVVGHTAFSALIYTCAEQEKFDQRNYEKFEQAFDHVCGKKPFPPTDAEFNNLYQLHNRVEGQRFPALRPTNRILSVSKLSPVAYQLFQSSDAGNLRPDRNGGYQVRALDSNISMSLCEAFRSTIVPNMDNSHE
jgi:hypothetical protein